MKRLISGRLRLLPGFSENGKSKSHLNWCALAVAVLVLAGLANAAEAPRGKSEWDQTVAAGKKEGEIAIYGSNGYEKVFEVFQKRYPEIKENAVTGLRGNEYGQRVDRQSV